MNGKVVLITGGAKRIGAETARTLHAAGMNIVIHYRSSRQEADELSYELNQLREHSATVLQADLDDDNIYGQLIEDAVEVWGRLDVLVNNASSFSLHRLAVLHSASGITLSTVTSKHHCSCPRPLPSS